MNDFKISHQYDSVSSPVKREHLSTVVDETTQIKHKHKIDNIFGGFSFSIIVP